MTTRRFPVALALASLTAAAGCAGSPSVEGEIVLAERDDARPLLTIRVIPDHPDGFDPRRIYKGEGEFGSEVVPVDEVEFPYAFRFEQPVEPPSGSEWRVLAWLADDADERWIHPGETFGTTGFRFVHVPHGSSYADGLRVELAEIAPPP